MLIGRSQSHRLALLRMKRLQKIAVPQLEDQKSPDFVRSVSAPTHVLVQQRLNRLWIEIPPLQSSRLKEQPRQFLLELISHPMDEWKRKTLLGAIDNFFWNAEPLRQLLKNVFLVAFAQLPMGRQRRDLLNKKMVENG